MDRLDLRLGGVIGWPVGTILRGRTVIWQGALVGPSQGEAVLFEEALASAG